MLTTWLRIRESFWFLPTVLGVVALVLAEVLVGLDRTLNTEFAGIPLLETLSASGGRALLSTIGGSMLTVAGTTFSITISVLATTSSTYGPRLVSNFMSDRANQFVLAVFTSTFLYCLVVMRTVHTEVDDTSAFVPVIAVHVAVLLGIADVGVLVFFIHHIAKSVQITSLQHRVKTDLDAAAALVYPRDPDARAVTEPLDSPRAAVSVRSTTDGYVQAVDLNKLARLAKEKDVVLDLVAMPGVYAIVDDVLVTSTGAVDDDDIRSSFTFGNSRTTAQDVAFATQQLVEVAVRGLSSGSNDPYTGVSSLDFASGSFVPLWRGVPRLTGWKDDDDTLRVVTHWPPLEDLVHSILEGIVVYAKENPLTVAAGIRFAERLDMAASPANRGKLDPMLARLRNMLAEATPTVG